MPDSLYGARLQGIMVYVFIKPCVRLSNDEYNYRESLRARVIEGIGHWLVSITHYHASRDVICVVLTPWMSLLFADKFSYGIISQVNPLSFFNQATFCGSSLGKRAGYHFNTADFESMGYHLCDTLLDYCDPDDSKVIS